MSIASTIATMRKSEILADLPNMNMNDLHASRAELKSVLYSNSPDRNKQELADITLIITREIHARAEAQQVKDGNTPDDQNKAILKGAKELREVDNNRIAQSKLIRARDDFDQSTDKIGFIEEHGNPWEKSASDYL